MSTAPFKVVRLYDPAIDIEGCNINDYVTSRDVSTLRYLEGARPAVYHCRPLTRAEIREVRNKASDADRYEAAFVRGLIKVEQLYREDGSRSDWARDEDKSGKARPIHDSVIEALFAESDVQEIGAVILARSFLANGSQAFYPLLRISQDALTGSLLHRAERKARSSSSDAGKPQHAEQEAASNLSDSDAPTGATAAAE